MENSLLDFVKNHPEYQFVLDEWDYQNNILNPSEISPHSHKFINFICDKGHKFQQILKNRTCKNPRKCPICSNKQVLFRFNDLETYCKNNNRNDILKSWDYEKNSVKPSEIYFGTSDKYWFKCDLGHSCFQSVKSKVLKNAGCLICLNKELLKGFNDLETYCHSNKLDYILKEWDYSKNNFKPSDIIYGYSGKIYWICPYGHSYNSELIPRLKHNIGCPVCSNKQVLTGYNDLQKWVENNPEYQFVLDEWDYGKNNIKISEILPGSEKEIFFICKNGHSYSMPLFRRTGKDKRGCPYCSHNLILPGFNDLAAYCKNNNRQDILDSWDYEKNNIKPSEILPGSHQKIWFKCPNGHNYQQMLKNKTEHFYGCPECNSSKSVPELTIYEIIKNYDNSVISGYNINGWEIDIYVPEKKLCVEYDGIHYHNSDIVKGRELRKNISILEDINDYTFVRIKETEDESNIRKFKEISDNGLIIYYINKKYDKDYFKRLSEIIKDMLGIYKKYTEIYEIYKRVKLSRISAK